MITNEREAMLNQKQFNFIIILLLGLYLLFNSFWLKPDFRSFVGLAIFVFYCFIVFYFYRLNDNSFALVFILILFILNSLLISTLGSLCSNLISNFNPFYIVIISNFLLLFILKPFAGILLKLKYQKKALISKTSSISIIFITLIMFLVHYQDSYQSPDMSSLILIAKVWQNHPSLRPVLQIPFDFSDGFIRNLFIKTSNNTMTSQYPPGAISLIGYLFLIGIPPWIINLLSYYSLFPLLFVKKRKVQSHSNKNDLIDSNTTPILYLLFSFSPAILQPLGLLFSLDLIILPLSILIIIVIDEAINQHLIDTNRRITNLDFILICSLIFSLITFIKISTVLITLFILLPIAINSFLKLKGRVSFKKFLSKYKAQVGIIMIFIISSFILSIEGYSKQFTLSYKFTKLLDVSLTIRNLVINLFGLFFIISPILIIIWANFNKLKKSEKFDLIITNLLFILFILFWNSSSIYPFNIGVRYYLPIYVYLHYLLKDYSIKFSKRGIIFLIIFYLSISSVVIIQQEYTDNVNNQFTNEIYKLTENNSVILTMYYEKLLHERITFHYLREDVINVISILLSLNISVYIIPDGVKYETNSYFISLITHSFKLSLILNFIPDVPYYQFTRYLDYHVPRTVYRISQY